MFGTVWCALSAVSGQLFGIFTTDIDERGLTPELIKRQPAPAVWAASCPDGTRGKSKLISASWQSACSRCCFFTHGWFNQRTHHHSAHRRINALRWAAQKCAIDGVRVQCALGVLRADAVAKIRSSAAALQFVERHAWIPSIGAEYLVGIDGLSLLLVLLTSVVIPFAFLAQRMDRGAAALMLIMQSALYGTFTAQNFVLWFLFYEMSLVPAFLLIKIWGGENRDRAATKFFLYTFLGSIAMLLAFLGIYFARGTFDFAVLATLGKNGLLTGNMAWLVFAGIFLGLAVKVPLFPFHTWLPDAYQTAPIGVSMVLTGVLSKMGVYGFVRLLLPLFPNEIKIVGPWLLGLAVCSIVFAPLAAWAQRDLKRMVAYLSINHLGYCMLGLFAVTASPIVAARSTCTRR
jgi:proton-translocating NADH-quinone oxidoreductase, chain M